MFTSSVIVLSSIFSILLLTYTDFVTLFELIFDSLGIL